MCDPVTAIAITSAALTALQQQTQASAENKYEQALYGQRKEEALDAYAQLNAREQQERAAAGQDIQRVTAQARQAAGAAKLQALEAGVRGRSVDLLLNSFTADRLAAVDAVQQNLEFGHQQLEAQRRSALRVQPPRIHKGPFDSFLGIASLGTQAAGAYYENKPVATPA